MWGGNWEWVEQNHAAGSTKEQSTGHRQDTLDDFNAYWNWMKLHRLCTSIDSILVIYDDAYIINQLNLHIPSSKSTGMNGKTQVMTSQDSHHGSQMKLDDGGKKWRRSRFLGGMGTPTAYIKWIPPSVRSNVHLSFNIVSVCLIPYKFLRAIPNPNI